MKKQNNIMDKIIKTVQDLRNMTLKEILIKYSRNKADLEKVETLSLVASIVLFILYCILPKSIITVILATGIYFLGFIYLVFKQFWRITDIELINKNTLPNLLLSSTLFIEDILRYLILFLFFVTDLPIKTIGGVFGIIILYILIMTVSVYILIPMFCKHFEKKLIK